MKGILIDVNNRTITEIQVNNVDGNCLSDLYKNIGCDLVELIDIDDDNCVFFDEEGLLKLTEKSNFFLFDGYPQPIAGNGVILGFNEEGDSIDTTLSVEEIKTKIKFFNIQEVRIFFNL